MRNTIVTTLVLIAVALSVLIVLSKAFALG
jgi:hypothetical protein